MARNTRSKVQGNEFTKPTECRWEYDAATGEAILRVPVHKLALDRARPSSTGKMMLVHTSGGWQTVPGIDCPVELRGSYSFGFYPKR